ncbi:uncharacterized protein EDB91DRAFT_1348322 [Suillus paluster]|uniref:uncharacterized protein n=1 Tax=Suillus paluster TaxID=48578 RepID=UPI001B886E1D|nr:uncharacterized protein EDB91DRAFT_1348322 [Suillus paluster]KAG1735313.1 hypothetical protein EDB91DRAFT_1348322 [Suillus paluster]
MLCLKSSSSALEYVAAPPVRQRSPITLRRHQSSNTFPLPPSSDARLNSGSSPARAAGEFDDAVWERQMSEDDVVQSRQESRETITGESARLVLPPQPVYYDAMSLLDGSARPSDDSLRVTYEDPGQEAEKRRLMALLGDESVRGGGRKSTRIAGF